MTEFLTGYVVPAGVGPGRRSRPEGVATFDRRSPERPSLVRSRLDRSGSCRVVSLDFATLLGVGA
jgi:hypothetical protein